MHDVRGLLPAHACSYIWVIWMARAASDQWVQKVEHTALFSRPIFEARISLVGACDAESILGGSMENPTDFFWVLN